MTEEEDKIAFKSVGKRPRASFSWNEERYFVLYLSFYG